MVRSTQNGDYSRLEHQEQKAESWEKHLFRESTKTRLYGLPSKIKVFMQINIHLQILDIFLFLILFLILLLKRRFGFFWFNLV